MTPIEDSLAETPQTAKESEIASLRRRVEHLHQEIDTLLEKARDLGVGYHDLLEHLLAEGGTRREREESDTGPEIGHAPHSLPYIRHRVDEAGRKVAGGVQRAEHDLEAQGRVYQELLPDL